MLCSKRDVAFVSRFYMACTLFSLYILYSSFIFINHCVDVTDLICEDNTVVHSFRLPEFLFLASFKETHLLSCLQGGSFADILSYILGPLVGISYESAGPNVGIFCCTNMKIPDAQ